MHTPHACSICTDLHVVSETTVLQPKRQHRHNVCWWPFRPVTSVHVQGSRTHGQISRCGRQAWAKSHYLWHSWLVQNNSKHILRPVFHRFRRICSLYKSFRCLDRPDWRCNNDDNDNDRHTNQLLYLYCTWVKIAKSMTGVSLILYNACTWEILSAIHVYACNTSQRFPHVGLCKLT